MLLTMKAYSEGMRALLYQTSLFIDLSKHHPDTAKREYYDGQVAVLTPICKAYCSDFGFRVTELAVQTYGGYGYCSEYPVEQYMRDCKISSIYEGTNAIQSLDLIGRKLGLKGGQYFRELYERITNFCATNEAHAKLGDACKQLKKAADQVGQIAMQFAQWSMSGNMNLPMLNANNFLNMTGDVIIAHLLLDQAVLADSQLAKIAADSADGKFYTAKVKTAQFFVANILPQVTAHAKAILAADQSALDCPL